ncbi:hypothetical protein CLOM_g5519 [Closterium sp. NIES-68]|nr:hypothetical protein CLOM_g5519 [Closterium sp. NIES-68]GJP84771.1 hypothetical protein CLOP_g14826 [Closterium sp. NIES-67]
MCDLLCASASSVRVSSRKVAVGSHPSHLVPGTTAINSAATPCRHSPSPLRLPFQRHSTPFSHLPASFHPRLLRTASVPPPPLSPPRASSAPNGRSPAVTSPSPPVPNSDPAFSASPSSAPPHSLAPSPCSVPFVLSPSDLSSASSAANLSIEDYIVRFLLQPATDLARPPISRFHVSAIAVGAKTGRAFLGVNLEFPGVPLHNSVHAEQFAVASAALHGEPALSALLVSRPPCGHCRQFLQELRGAEGLRVVIAEEAEAAEETSLTHLLPHRFGPHSLLADDFPLLLEQRDNSLQLIDPVDVPSPLDFVLVPPLARSFSSASPSAVDSAAAAAVSAVSPAAVVSSPLGNEAVLRALDAANASYAPYSLSPSGVALVTRTGAVHAGSYIESAAYNPSLPALQAALIALVVETGGEGAYEDVVHVALVEKEGAQVRFDSITALSVARIAPHATFSLHLARESSLSGGG